MTYGGLQKESSPSRVFSAAAGRDSHAGGVMTQVIVVSVCCVKVVQQTGQLFRHLRPCVTPAR